MLEICFSKNLKQLMKEFDVNQVNLSNAISISQSAISSWLANKKEPSLSSLWMLADYFNCSIDELVGRKPF
jgi:transcriptional regulator with XRE-family HTH domain